MAFEVKSGRPRDVQPGIGAFTDRFAPTRQLLVGGDGIDVEEFLAKPVHWLQR